MSANQELFEFKFYEWEEKFKDKPYLKQPFGDQWEEYTWGEVGDMARRLATGLRNLGLRDGAHIGIYSKNCREWIISDLAIVMAGYVSVPFFPSLNPFSNGSQCVLKKFLVEDISLLPTFEQIAFLTNSLKVIFTGFEFKLSKINGP